MDLAYKTIVEKIKKTDSDKIAGLTGDLTNMETLYCIKEFFNTTIKSRNLDSRSDSPAEYGRLPTYRRLPMIPPRLVLGTAREDLDTCPALTKKTAVSYNHVILT